MGRLAEILDDKPQIVAHEPLQHLPLSRTGRANEFRNVGFHYPSDVAGEPRWVLRNVSFKVPAGATLGVVGATGSGKSALIELIPRMYDPQEGEILIDGVPTRNVAPAELREEIGFVPQESLLFSETIGSNLSYGTNGLTQTGEWAANVAQLDQTIGDFPGRYETILGERGINLSGGQKQRASLARALARKPSIVGLAADDFESHGPWRFAAAPDILSRSTSVRWVRGIHERTKGSNGVTDRHRRRRREPRRTAAGVLRPRREVRLRGPIRSRPIE